MPSETMVPWYHGIVPAGQGQKTHPDDCVWVWNERFAGVSCCQDHREPSRKTFPPTKQLFPLLGTVFGRFLHLEIWTGCGILLSGSAPPPTAISTNNFNSKPTSTGLHWITPFLISLCQNHLIHYYTTLNSILVDYCSKDSLDLRQHSSNWIISEKSSWFKIPFPSEGKLTSKGKYEEF